MKRSVGIALVMLLCGCRSGADAQAQSAPVRSADPDSILPEATGLLITAVVPGTQAKKLGVKFRDILVSYDGAPTPDMAELVKAKAGAEKGKAKRISVEFIREGEIIVLDFAPGSLGLVPVPVVKGVPLPLRPPATGVRFDFANLKEKPRDWWYAFTINGKHVGFEHNVLALVDGKLMLTSEVAFDYGKGGIQHFHVQLSATAEPRPRVLACKYRFVPADFICEGKRDADGAWVSVQSWTEKKEGKDVRKREKGKIDKPPADMLPDYLVTLLAAWMPRQKGACFHYTLLAESEGVLKQAAATVVARPRAVWRPGEPPRNDTGARSPETKRVGGTSPLAAPTPPARRRALGCHRE